MVLKACTNCMYLSEEDTCPLCAGETTRDWQGFVIILDYSRSQIAEKMGFEHNGKYALKVR